MSIQVNQLPSLPTRPEDAHKGTFGHVLVIGGSSGMSGAVSLAGLSALRSGAGLVTVACPKPIQQIVACFNPSYMTWGLSNCEEGELTDASIKEIMKKVHHYDAVALGPGLGKSTLLKLIVRELYERVTSPMVIDADALNALSSLRLILDYHEGPRVFTPHPGEFSRFLRISVAELSRNREQIAIDFARQNKLVLLLKGENTLVTDGEQIYFNDTGNSGLATGGTGDVLTGMIAAFIGQGSTPFDAAVLGAHIHGKAAEIYSSQRSSRSMIASDLVEFIGLAFHEMERGQFRHFGNS